MSPEDKQWLVDREASFDKMKGKTVTLVFVEGDEVEICFTDDTFVRMGIDFFNRQPLIVVQKKGRTD